MIEVTKEIFYAFVQTQTEIEICTIEDRNRTYHGYNGDHVAFATNVLRQYGSPKSQYYLNEDYYKKEDGIELQSVCIPNLEDKPEHENEGAREAVICNTAAANEIIMELKTENDYLLENSAILKRIIDGQRNEISDLKGAFEEQAQIIDMYREVLLEKVKDDLTVSQESSFDRMNRKRCSVRI